MNRRDFIKGLSGLVLSSQLYPLDSFASIANDNSKKDFSLLENNTNLDRCILDDNSDYKLTLYSQKFSIADLIVVEFEPKTDIDLILMKTTMQKYPDYKWEFKGNHADFDGKFRDYYPDYTPKTQEHNFISRFVYNSKKAYALTATDRHSNAQDLKLSFRLYKPSSEIFKPSEILTKHYEINISKNDWGTGYIPIPDPNIKRTYTKEQLEEYNARLYREQVVMPKIFEKDTRSYNIFEGYTTPRPKCSDYGDRRFFYIKGRSLKTSWPRNPHMGVDCSGNYGTSIKAALSGKVAYTDTNLPGIGSVVVLDHGLGLFTMYGHTSKNYVKIGDEVSKGQTIALVGSNGVSTAPHLHFNAKLHGININPLSLEILNVAFSQNNQ